MVYTARSGVEKSGRVSPSVPERSSRSTPARKVSPGGRKECKRSLKAADFK
jgi:hypothetical protein